MKSTNGKRLSAATVSLLLAGSILFSCGCTTLSLFNTKPKSHRRLAVPEYAHPKYPGLVPQKKKPKSWLGSWAEPEEPMKAGSVPQWLKRSKRIPFGEPQ